MRRGEVYDARLHPFEAPEQAGTRPVVVISRNAVNDNLAIVIAVPCTTLRPNTGLHPGRVVLRAPDGGLSVDSIALCEQVRAVARTRLVRHRGTLSARALAQIERGLRIVLDLSS